MRQIQISIFLFLFLLLSLLNPTTPIHDISSILSSYPSLSTFSRLLSATSIPSELSSRSSLTVLAVPNQFIHSSSSFSSDIADVLRYHILLEYISEAELRHIPSYGKLVTTLYQTTGRASSDYGSLNLTCTPFKTLASSPSPFAPSNASILSQIATFPYNLSILAVDSLLIPSGFDLSASSETKPNPPPPVNITQVLLDAHDFNVAASMLDASGVSSEFESYEHGAGITIFVPTDLAFANNVQISKFRSLPANKKALVLKFHALHSYYPLGSLESIVNPAQPTVATEDTVAGVYTLNITRVNGSVAIGTGLVQAAITRTVFDQNPVAIFAVSKVLLPKEIFGDRDIVRDAQTYDVAVPPAMGPDVDRGGYVDSSGDGNYCSFRVLGIFCCMVLIYCCDSGRLVNF